MVVDARKREFVVYGDAVEGTEIDVETVGAIVFVYEVHFGDPVTLRWLNDTLGEHVGDGSNDSVVFQWR